MLNDGKRKSKNIYKFSFMISNNKVKVTKKQNYRCSSDYCIFGSFEFKFHIEL